MIKVTCTSLFTLCTLLCCTAPAITIGTVPVGDIGNPNDPATGNLYGGVNYAYNIGLTEVTCGQYAAFLNAVAGTDTYGLYDEHMVSDHNTQGILQTSSGGRFHYQAIFVPDRPIANVTWLNAARFANWLNNGQPTGAEDATTTEDGAYTLNGTKGDGASITRNQNAKWFIPTENEWYKAAYYQPAASGGDSDGYWEFPTRSNTRPLSQAPPGTPGTSGANYFDGLNYPATGRPYNRDENLLTVAGAYSQSSSYYGTFDQGGNLGELTEAMNNNQRVYRGGSWNFGPVPMQADRRSSLFANMVEDYIGFRVASTSGTPGTDGDFNGDGVVDMADYVVWRNSADDSLADYNLWRAHFGQSVVEIGVGEAATVPEPSMLAILTVVAGSVFIARRRPTAHNRV